MLRWYGMQVPYATLEYWDDRYRKYAQRFDWYFHYWSIKPLLDRYARKDAPVLQVGVGLSTLQDDMAADGYKDIVNVDFSDVAITHMKNLAACSRCTVSKYLVADVLSMPMFADSSFQFIIDKGTMDSVLCGQDSRTNAITMLEVCSSEVFFLFFSS